MFSLPSLAKRGIHFNEGAVSKNTTVVKIHGDVSITDKVVPFNDIDATVSDYSALVLPKIVKTFWAKPLQNKWREINRYVDVIVECILASESANVDEK